jgi:epoxyqueuosine reductase
MVYGCDICQDVCPWNRGVEKRRQDEASSGEPAVSLADWLRADDASLIERYRRLYVPRNDPRYLRRNALVALGNVGGEQDAALAEPFAAGDDELLREHAEWALARIAERESTH